LEGVSIKRRALLAARDARAVLDVVGYYRLTAGRGTRTRTTARRTGLAGATPIRWRRFLVESGLIRNLLFRFTSSASQRDERRDASTKNEEE
jgi:hypothetical protein